MRGVPNVDDFDPGMIARAIDVEMEHTTDREAALGIVMDHLREDPRYYEKLWACGLGLESVNEKRRRVTITAGMANTMNGASAARVCGACSLSIPKYPGRYPSTCPACGGNLVKPRGEKKVYAEGRELADVEIEPDAMIPWL